MQAMYNIYVQKLMYNQIKQNNTREPYKLTYSTNKPKNHNDE
jgi:hypothetical protein